MTPPDPPRMTGQRPLPYFAERQTYRRRRLADAARFLPILGLMLWMVPLLWGTDEGAQRASAALVYLFCVWGGLILAAAAIILALARHRHATLPPSDAEEGR